ncbi:uncharacterized protein LOC126267935 [Schistocerca gregaria]|uniref:uncharacterized protein LOC126267935 n=1 Tax=Schistocerca gregaria TaxID=7010 RepID=UPI00211DA558|nr:uncharacterized protein LOC126267935 [Schistocerca gregaria]
MGGLHKSQNQAKKLTNKMISLIDKRRKMKVETLADKIEYTELCETMRKTMKDDVKKFEEDMLKASLENKCSLKIAKREAMIGDNQLIVLDTGKKETLVHIENIYSKLYSKISDDILILDKMDASVFHIPEILLSDIKHAIDKMTKRTAPGSDDFSVYIFKLMDDKSIRHLAKLLSDGLQSEKLLRDWNKVKTILIIKRLSTKRDLPNR